MTCQDCNKRNTCHKPCKEIEKILQDNGIRNSEWIRPESGKTRRKNGCRYREIPFSALKFTQNGEIDPYIVRG